MGQVGQAALNRVAEEALVAALAAQGAVRDQIMAKGCLQPFGFIWQTEDYDGTSQSSPTIIRADPDEVSETLSNGHLIRDVRTGVRKTDAAAVVLVAIGYAPTPFEPGIVYVQLETRAQSRRIWVAPFACPHCGNPIGDFCEIEDHRDFPEVIPTHTGPGWLN